MGAAPDLKPAMRRNRRARPSHPRRRRHQRLVIAAALGTGPARVVAHASAPEVPGAQRQLDAAPTGTIAARTRSRTLAPAAVVAARVIVVVAQPEEPDKPDHQQPDVEDAEANHEDPPLGGHRVDATAMEWRVEGPFATRRVCSSRGCSART